MVLFSIKSINASQGYHLYKETTWSDVKIDDVVKVDPETDQSSLRMILMHVP